jgi:hypothetical protein
MPFSSEYILIVLLGQIKYIIIGPDNFGASLVEKLTALGHEIIGIDDRMN